MKIIVEKNLETAEYWLTQDISKEERQMWKKMKSKCKQILKEYEKGIRLPP